MPRQGRARGLVERHALPPQRSVEQRAQHKHDDAEQGEDDHPTDDRRGTGQVYIDLSNSVAASLLPSPG